MEDINSVVEDIKKYLKSDLVFGSKLLLIRILKALLKEIPIQ